MNREWELIDDLLGGTIQMRAKGERWLPREPKERIDQYKVRLNRSFLFNALRDTIDSISGKPFSKPTSVTDTNNEFIDDIKWNVDKQGKDITQFCREVFTDGLTYGLCHIYVDYPTTTGTESLKQERDDMIRPFFHRISPKDLIGWRYEVDSHGRKILTEIRFIERLLQIGDDYSEKIITRVRRVRNDGTWEMFQADDKGSWTSVSSGQNTLTEIPLVTIYFNQTGFLTAKPPFSDLAELNLCHWQSYSDQRNYLRFCRIGMLSATGLTAEEFDAGLEVGPTQILKSRSPSARFQYIEASGTAAGIGEEDLKRTEERMEIMGLRPMIARTASSTASGKILDTNQKETEAQSWIRSMENGLEEAYEYAGQWIGFTFADDFSIDIFNDFGVTISGTQDATAILQARMSGQITQKTFLEEWIRRGLLKDGIDINAEVSDSQQENANAMLGFGSGEPNAASGSGQSSTPPKQPPPPDKSPQSGPQIA